MSLNVGSVRGITREELFNEVEELVGTYPSGDALRNALSALFTCDVDIWSDFNGIPYGPADPTELSFHSNIDGFARDYEAKRGTHMHIMGDYSVAAMTIEKELRATFAGCNEECNRPA